ncbi:hypothetical protein K501DRAFT_331136 [Backusella circina FSU 941]|nr:hypothetical protein K501DRAFT_331136 [Backusella circina FSU 941]
MNSLRQTRKVAEIATGFGDLASFIWTNSWGKHPERGTSDIDMDDDHRSPEEKAPSSNWDKALAKLADAYLLFLGKNKALEAIIVEAKKLLEKDESLAFTFEKQEISYCSNWRTLPFTLVELGFPPLTPSKSQNAVHFSLCEGMVSLKGSYYLNLIICYDQMIRLAKASFIILQYGATKEDLVMACSTDLAYLSERIYDFE